MSDHICIFVNSGNYTACPSTPDGVPNGAHITLSAAGKGIVGTRPPALVERAVRAETGTVGRKITWELRTGDGLARWVGTVHAYHDSTISVALTSDEKAAVKAAADALRQTPSAWTRGAILTRLR